jgi:hypothetical protein
VSTYNITMRLELLKQVFLKVTVSLLGHHKMTLPSIEVPVVHCPCGSPFLMESAPLLYYLSVHFRQDPSRVGAVVRREASC